MKSLKLMNFVTLFATALIGSAVAQADLYGSLSPADQATINKGEQVVQTEDMAGSAWPKATVLQRVEATPEQVAGVMFDFPLHTKMFEGISKCEPKSPGAAVTELDYVMTLPSVLGISLPDEVYTVLDKLTVFGDAGYDLSWTMVKASSMQNTVGSVKFEKLGNGTLVSYTNFINPPAKYGSLAKMIKGMAISRVKDSVKALAKQVLAERDGDMAKLNAQTAALSKALGR